MTIKCPHCRDAGRTTIVALTHGRTLIVHAGRSVPVGIRIENYQEVAMQLECGKCHHVWTLLPPKGENDEDDGPHDGSGDRRTP